MRKNSKLEGKSPFPLPKKVKCFECGKDFFIKFVISQQNYSRKNNWKYWTGQGNKSQEICNDCLKKLYYDKSRYWQTIKDLKKRSLLRKYMFDGYI